MKKVFISGPVSSNPKENIARAINAANLMVSGGFLPFVPHLYNVWHQTTPQDYEYWMRLCFAWLAECDILLRLAGDSPGADREVAFAISNNMPVWYLCEVCNWYGSGKKCPRCGAVVQK